MKTLIAVAFLAGCGTAGGGDGSCHVDRQAGEDGTCPCGGAEDEGNTLVQTDGRACTCMYCRDTEIGCSQDAPPGFAFFYECS